MDDLIKNWRILLLVALLLGAFAVLGFNGLNFGIDFSGGTLFQVHFAEKADSPEKMERIRSTISQRLDWTGLKDTIVQSWGDEFIIAQIAETDPEKVERIEALLRQQGKFEVVLDGKTVFTGEDIIEISRDPASGYGFRKQGDTIMWILPFKLKSSAGRAFTEAAFHKCSVVSYDPQAGTVYDCEKTYFFIDKPTNSVLVIPQDVYSNDNTLFLQGNFLENIPQNTRIEEVLLNSQLPNIVVDDSNISPSLSAKLEELFLESKTAIIPSTASKELKDLLLGIGFELKEIPVEQDVPWVWTATGAKQVISLSEDVANMDVATVEEAKIMSDLIIRGVDPTLEDAQASLNDLTVLLESGSLSVPVDSVSRETISPLLGEDFLVNVALIGIVALVVVSLVIFVRYRVIKLTIPIVFTGLSEVILILGFASMIGWALDLAAVAGILTAVGSGVDDQIIITDELVRDRKEVETSLLRRIQRAFFIIVATASTVIATMAPIFFLGMGLGKLVGFAFTTISGVLIGVFITRPAFGEIAKRILSK